MRETIYNTVKALAAVPHTAVSADGATNGTAVSVVQTDLNFRVAELIVQTGTLTDGTYTIAIEESANGTTGWTAVPAARLQGSLTALDTSDTLLEVGVVPNPGSAAYLRATVTASDVTTGGSISAIWLLSSGSRTPVR